MSSGEEALQISVFQWFSLLEYRYPILKYAIHVPNGGWRTPAQGGKLKACGVKKGVPDILLPCRYSCYGGLAIELKHGKNRVTKEQSEWLEALGNFGYLTGTAYDFDDVKLLVTHFLGVSKV